MVENNFVYAGIASAVQAALATKAMRARLGLAFCFVARALELPQVGPAQAKGRIERVTVPPTVCSTRLTTTNTTAWEHGI